MSCFKSLSLFGSLVLSACSRQNVDPIAGGQAHNGVTNLALQGAPQAVIRATIRQGFLLSGMARADGVIGFALSAAA